MWSHPRKVYYNSGVDTNAFLRFAAEYYHRPVEFAANVLGIDLSRQQRELVEDIVDPEQRLISVRSGHGCFAKGTPIMLACGEVVPVENVGIGDRLMGPDGFTYRYVTGEKRGREPMYRFTYMDGTCHVFNESHILCLVATNSKGKRVAGEKTTVTVREWLTWGEDKKRCHAIYRSPVLQFDNYLPKPTIPPYILGVWLGDGHSNAARITTADPEIRDALEEYAESVNGYISESNASGKAVTLNISGHGNHHGCNAFLSGLKGMGLLDNKHIPDNYLYASKEERLELLAGLMDTDGSLDKAGYDFIQKNKKLAHQTAWLARSVGCHSTVKRVKKTCANNGVKGTYWRVTIGRNISQIPVRIDRKKRKPGPRQRNNLHFGIRSCEPLGMGDYYGFTLSGPDGRFLGGDFTVLHNTGKSTSLAVATVHFACTRHPWKAIQTAPSASQLWDALWPETVSMFQRLPAALRPLFNITSDRIRLVGDERCFVSARTSTKEKPESLAGVHSENVLLMPDEASAIPDEVFESAQGSMSDKNATTVMTSNPTRTSGFFYDSHHTNSALWKCHHWSSTESPFVNEAFIEQIRKTYGEGSNQWRVRVLGEFPDTDDDTLISRADVEAALDRDIELDPKATKVWMCDPARFGSDRTVLAEALGSSYSWLEVVSGKSTTWIAGWIKHKYDELQEFERPSEIIVDVIGLGAGVVDNMTDAGLPVTPVNVSESALAFSDGYRLRDQLWLDMKRWLQEGLGKLPSDPKLREAIIADLTAPTYSFMANGKLKVESKAEMKRRAQRSTDIADCLNLRFASEPAIMLTNRRGNKWGRSMKRNIVGYG